MFSCWGSFSKSMLVLLKEIARYKSFGRIGGMCSFFGVWIWMLVWKVATIFWMWFQSALKSEPNLLPVQKITFYAWMHLLDSSDSHWGLCKYCAIHECWTRTTCGWEVQRRHFGGQWLAWISRPVTCATEACTVSHVEPPAVMCEFLIVDTQVLTSANQRMSR